MSRDFQYLLWLLTPLLLFGFLLPNWLDHNIAWKGSDAHLTTFSEMCSSPQANSADVIFLGTSRTMNGLHSPELDRLSNRTHLNLGLNWFGHGQRLNQLDSWLKHHEPRVVVMEAPLLFRFDDHPHMNHTLQPTTLNSLWSSSPLRALKAQLLQIPRGMVSSAFPASEADTARLDRSGYMKIQSPAGLGNTPNDWAKEKLKELKHSPPSWPGTLKRLYYQARYFHQWNHLEQMAQLCKGRDIHFILLALPKCGFDEGDPWLRKRQEAIAPLWRPPTELLQHYDLWRDVGHLNDKGALKLASWLNSKLEQLL